jgi:hypothetical protein
MKQITKSEVHRVASQQMLAQGSTTTKDIKDQLRREGFFAKQWPVRRFTRQLAPQQA